MPSTKKATPLIGRHVSAAGGSHLAPERAAAIGCDCFQFFSRSPRGGAAPILTPEIVTAFKANMMQFGQRACFIHTPYFINFASKNTRILKGSIEIVRGELERGSLLGVAAAMTHIGSAKEYADREEALTKVVSSIVEVLRGYTGTTKFLLENAAGAGDVIGVGFAELGRLVSAAEKTLKKKKVIGICLDTCHAFASGYDIRTKKGVDAMLAEFDEELGLERLAVIHANDSMTEFDGRRDRHEHIGEGKIGADGFTALLSHPRLRHLPFILETPEDPQGDERDVLTLRRLAGVLITKKK
jgi:deoxyribonuclease-4